MVDVQETPATPPFDGKGDDRIGLFVAGATLMVLGWGLGIVLNLVLHWAARSGPFVLWTVHFGPTLGAYSWAVYGLGLATGIVGVALVYEGVQAPRGPFVLPGADY